MKNSINFQYCLSTDGVLHLILSSGSAGTMRCVRQSFCPKKRAGMKGAVTQENDAVKRPLLRGYFVKVPRQPQRVPSALCLVPASKLTFLRCVQFCPGILDGESMKNGPLSLGGLRGCFECFIRQNSTAELNFPKGSCVFLRHRAFQSP